MPIQRIALVGTGKLARALALSMPDAIAVVAGRDRADAASVAMLTKGAASSGLSELAEFTFDVLWIATSDDAIADVARELSQLSLTWNAVVVVHSSGALGVAALDALVDRGASAIALHPNASLHGDVAIPEATIWGITPVDDATIAYGAQLIGSRAASILPVPEESRPLYHAAASVASNFTVTLWAIADMMYRRAGVDDVLARDLVAGFMSASIDSARADGVTRSLTGPVARGDKKVVEAQRNAIAARAPELLDVFDALVTATELLVRDES